MTRHAKALLVRLITTVLAVAGLALVTITTTPTAQAVAGDVGYADFQYGPPVTPSPTGFIDPDNSPTASKPQSKLWFAQGRWWGVLQQPNTTTLSIWSFSSGTQSWTDTGVVVDNRGTGAKQADVLWDGTKLYIASAGRDGTATGIRVSRFRYDTASATYVADGLSTTVNNGGVEAAVIAKDKTGRIWVAYTAGATLGRVVRVVASDAAQTTFSAPFTPPVAGTAVTTDDIATIVSHGDSVSVVWSNQNPDPTMNNETAIYAARHPNTEAPEAGWIASEKVLHGPSVADDHISLSSVEGNAAGSVFMIVKESADDPAHTDSTGLVKLVVLRPTGVWESYVHSTVKDDMTRPIVVLEPSKGLLHVFATSPVAGGIVYEKTTSMSTPGFASGKGTPYIQLADHTFINNATSTKQNITDESGILVLASDQKTGYYVHNYTPGSSSPVVKPVADFTYTPQTGPAPLAVQFTNTSKDATSVSWNFGDGSPASTEANPAHTFTKAGTYTVTLTASNYTGATSTKSANITVKLPVPVASFTSSPTTGPAPLAVKFTDTSTGPATSWAWTFGDGGKDTVQNPSHTFTKAGTYTVTLTATNESGSSTTTGTVVVGVSVPVASFTWSPTTGTAPLAVQFTDTSTGPPASWAWTFGDGGTSTLQSPSHTFAKGGTYTVSLKVTNASGTSTKTNAVVVAPAPVPAPPTPAPAPPTPVVVLDEPAAAVTLTKHVDVAWHATTAPATVKGYDVEVRSIGRSKGSQWTTTVLTNQTGGAVQVPGVAGYTYCTRVRGTNTAGVVGAWSGSSCTSLPLDDRALLRKGAWRKAGGTAYYMGTASITRERGASLSKTVTGKQVFLLIAKRSGGGKVKVYEGTKLVKKISLTAKRARTGLLVPVASHTEDTTSRYRVVVKSSGKPVVIDGLAVTR